MNIAILTLPLHKNIGGILQLYALHGYLKNKGHEVLVINRGFNKMKFSPGGFLNGAVFQPIIAYNINNFIKKHIKPLTKKIESTEELDCINRLDIDVVIVGSDQVWRLDYVIDMYKDYFLGFVSNKNIKKISYAASFGNDEWNFPASITNNVKELLQDFSAISVREKSGVSMCNDIFGINNVTHVLDPTLLLDKKDYINIIGSNKNKNHNGILTYFLDVNEQKNAILNYVSAELNLPAFSVNVEKSFTIKNLFKIHKCIYPSVEEWISGFNDCEYIITDSFHGVVFSLIFEKPFIAIGNEKRGIDRFISLLNMIDMRHRLIFRFDQITKELIHEKINFDVINKELFNFREVSKQYLLSSIKN